jgi:hypothetical protein
MPAQLFFVRRGFAQIDVQNKGFLCNRHFCTKTPRGAPILQGDQSNVDFNQRLPQLSAQQL